MLWISLSLGFFFLRSALAVAVWGQCGGIGYTGDTTCDAGTTCVYLNDYFWQCQYSTSTTTTTGSGTAPTGLPAAGYSQVTNFGSNPSNIGMYVYVPSGLNVAKPGLVVAMHYCTGSASAFYSGTSWKSYADSKKNFIVLYGDSPRDGKCWDVSTNATLTHDGGSDSLGVASAVRYALNNWSVDSSKVFVTGGSSGAMMANVLSATYPDLFKAAIAISGVPYSCFATTDGSLWNSTCSSGQVTHTGAEWLALVKKAYPSYTGSYPRMMLVHGTNDTTLYYQNFLEEIKQWTSVWGLSSTATTTTANDPATNVTHTTYGSAGNVQGYSVAGGTHSISYYETQQLAFFGL